MKNHYQAVNESGLKVFLTNESARFNPSLGWGNENLESFLMLAKELNIDLLYAYIKKNEKDAEPIIKEVGYHYKDIFHYFAPISQNIGSTSDQDELDDEDTPGAEEEKDLEAFLAADTEKYISEITSIFKDGKVSKFKSIDQVLYPYWKSHGIEYKYAYYEEEELNKLRTINNRAILEYVKESISFQKNLQNSVEFRSNALDFFKENKFKSIKKMHLSDYLTSQDILLTLTPITEDSLLNLINDDLKLPRLK